MNTPLHENFCERKAINAILYIAERVERKDFHQIFKILYFSDREHLSIYGRSITGDNYIAMPKGPVPSILFDIFKNIRLNNDQQYSNYFTVKGKYTINPMTEPNLKSLSKSDLKCLDEAIKNYGEMSFEELVNVSHSYAWNKTTLNTQISLENIILEAGNDQDYIDFLRDNNVYCNSNSNKCHCSTI
jgi:uncharacterized phage-associated protein